MQAATCDVLVVGAGPGGLAAAHAISRASGLSVLLAERAPVTRRGAGLGLEVNGMKALEAIHPRLLERVRAAASFLTGMRSLKADCTLVSESTGMAGRSEYDTQGYRTPCLLGWAELQQLLIDELPAGVAANLNIGLDFQRYEEDEAAGTITAHFAASEAAAAAGAPTRVTARLLVASDGYFSRVRRQCVADGPPAWGKTVVWRARLPEAEALAAGIHAPGKSSFFNDPGRFLFAYPISSGDVVWTVGISEDALALLGMDASSLLEQIRASSSSSSSSSSSQQQRHHHQQQQQQQQDQPATQQAGAGAGAGAPDYTSVEAQGFSAQDVARGEAARERCLRAMAGFGQPVLDVIRRTPAASIVEHGVWTRPPGSISAESYGKGRVVVVGDAAHPLRPTGQGLNQAVEDAWGLGAALAGCASGEAVALRLPALAAFRAAGAERARRVVAFTTAEGQASYRADRERASELDGVPVMAPAEWARWCHGRTWQPLVELAAAAAEQQVPVAR